MSVDAILERRPEMNDRQRGREGLRLLLEGLQVAKGYGANAKELEGSGQCVAVCFEGSAVWDMGLSYCPVRKGVVTGEIPQSG